jgi:hypothetical protein
MNLELISEEIISLITIYKPKQTPKLVYNN